MNVLAVRELRKSFRRDILVPRTAVLKGVDFSLKAGSITAFLGGNGAGKTTTIKCVLSLLTPDSGDIRFFGDKQISRDVKGRIGFLPERSYFYEYLTGIEFLQFYGELSGKWNSREIKKRALALLERVGLTYAKDRRLRHYSKGMLQKVGISQALIHEPELVILDEPMSGLDPDARMAVSEIIKDVAKQGAAVFFSSHLINDAEKLCDQVVMMKEGTTLYEGSVDQLLRQTQRGFNVQLAKDGEVTNKAVVTEADLQAELARAIKGGEQILEVAPLRMSLEEIFVSRALRGELMRAIWIVGTNTFREVIRDRILYSLFLFAIMTIGASLALGQLSFAEQSRISANFGLMAIHLSAVGIAIFVGATLVIKELDKQTILTVLVRPLNRTQFIIGKFIGLAFVIFAVMAGLTLILMGIFYAIDFPITSQLGFALTGILLESLCLLGFAMLFSVFTRPVLVVCFSVGIFLIGHWLNSLQFFAKRSPGTAIDMIYRVTRYLFPNLEALNWKSAVVYEDPMSFATAASPILYAVVWIVFIVAVTVTVFERKDLV